MTSLSNTRGLLFLDPIYLSWNAPMYHLQVEHTKNTSLPVLPRIKSRSSSQRRKQSADCMRKQRSLETEQQIEARLASAGDAVRKRRQSESLEGAERRRSSVRYGMQKRRAEERPESTDTRRASVCRGMQKHRAEESPESTDRRHASVRRGMQKHRAEENPQSIDRRRASDRQRQQKHRAEESPQSIDRRRASDRQRQQKHRAEESPESTDRRRASNKQRMGNNSAANTAKETTLEECRQMFLSKVSEGPIYACCSCLRLHYRSSVVHMKTEKYKAARSTAKILKTTDHPMTHDATWICNTCNNALKAGRLPTQSWANDLQLDDIPPALQGLRPLEIRLISQRIPFMKLVALPRGGQKAIHGSAVNVPSKVQSITTLQPRLPETAEVFAFKLKWKHAYKGHYMYDKANNGTRRAQIPRKPFDPPISWIVTQSLIYITSYFLSNSKYVIYIFLSRFCFLPSLNR